MGNSERITVEFDINVGGGYYPGDDYVKIMLVPEDYQLIPSSNTDWYVQSPYGYHDYTYSGQCNGEYGISKYSGHIYTQIPNPCKGENAYLVFMWRNEEHYYNSYATQPAPIVTNLSVKETPDSEVRLEKPKFSYAEVVSESSMTVMWSAGRDEQSWEVTLDTAASKVLVNDNSFIVTDLVNNTAYTLNVRAKKDSYYSDWMQENIFFSSDPEIWTHGPDSLSYNYATLTGAITYKADMKPVSYGLTYRKITESNWTYLPGYVRDEWEGQIEIESYATNLQPFTWYTVGAWAKLSNGDTITSNAETAHAFLTPDEPNDNATTLPYTSTFDNNDPYSLSKGFYNWYVGQPEGYNSNVLFISPDGNTIHYKDNAVFVQSYAQKLFKNPKSEYITVRVKADVDGTYFMNHNLSELGISLSNEGVGGFASWYETAYTVKGKTEGEQIFYIKQPEIIYPMEETPENLYLILHWEDMSSVENIDYDFGDLAAVVKSITIEQTPQDVVDLMPKCNAPEIDNVYLTSFTGANISWNWQETSWQYKLGENGEVVDIDNSYVSLNDLSPETEYTFFVRSKCEETDSWTDWSSIQFNTKALPELYTLPIKEENSNTAEVSAYLYHEYMTFNNITEFGFEYTKTSSNTSVKADDDWQKLPYSKLDTIYDYGSNILYKITAELNNLEENSNYSVREYAVTSNGYTVYSNERSIATGQAGLNTVDNTLNLNIYPNPAKDITVLSTETLNQTAYLYVYDLQGKLMHKQMVKQGEKTIKLDVSNFKSGVYYVQLKTQNAQTSEKLIVK